MCNVAVLPGTLWHNESRIKKQGIMMMKKKIAEIVLCTAMTLSLLAGCGKEKDKNQTNTPADQGGATTAETPQTTETPEASAGTPAATNPPADTPTPTLAPVTPEAEQKSNTIYVILPDIEEGTSAEMAAEIKKDAEGLGYQVELCEHDGEIEEQTAFFNQAIEKNALGIICDNAGASVTSESVSMAKNAGIPTILINKGIDGE